MKERSTFSFKLVNIVEMSGYLCVSLLEKYKEQIMIAKRHLLSLLGILLTSHALGAVLTLDPNITNNATMEDHSIRIGEWTNTNLSPSPYSAFYGNAACQYLSKSFYVTCLGPSAGRYASDAEGTLFIGLSAGYFASNVQYSILQGYAAGRYLNEGGNTYSLIEGYAAGEYSNHSHCSVLKGMHAGYRASHSPNSVMIGKFAGAFANHSPNSVFIGTEAAGIIKKDSQTNIASADHVVRGIYIGSGAGKNSTNTNNVILIGTDTKAESGVANAIGLGTGAHLTKSNSLNVPVLAKTGGGILITDEQGNITTSDALSKAIATIDSLTARIAVLERSLPTCKP